MQPSERTPLLAKLPKLDIHPMRRGFVGLICKNIETIVFSLPLLAWKHHWFCISMALISAVVCWGTGFAEVSLLDPLIFKSMFVLFSFTMGLRNVRALDRRDMALCYVNKIFAAAWGIYVSLPDEQRKKIKAPLVTALRAAADHIFNLTDRQHYWYGLVGLDPPRQSSDMPLKPPPGSYAEEGSNELSRARSQHFASRDAVILGPRVFLVMSLLFIEGEIEHAEPSSSGEQKVRRNFWHHRPQLLENYDQLVALTVPSVSNRYLGFVNMCLFLFAVCLPWGISSTGTTLQLGHLLGYSHMSLSAGLFLILNTLFCVIVLFTLEALTIENEDPLGNDEEDVDVRYFAELFATSVNKYEEQLKIACEERPGSRGRKNEGYLASTQQHAALCGITKEGEAAV
eukprot:TRINITY_DN57414_c0_g1_i1.p1 TRINITY_DN57414_c0_g1~~TRINITY_DN57414_c0_g1_i1.p1  ORF type:complete len:399 (+),score=69.05 TRINITY_DN57414_c0_g1_i1:148-1344(+)